MAVPAKRTHVQLPHVQAMLLADHVYIDRTGKAIIAGTFNVLNVEGFPATFTQVSYLYINLIDIRTDVALTVRFVHLDSNQVLMQSPAIPVKKQDPLRGHTIALPIPALPLPAEGGYRLELMHGERIVSSLLVQARQRPGTPGGNDA